MAEFFYERSKMDVFTDIKWINSMKMFKDNPSVLGFFTEKACIASISRNGLMVDKSSFKPDRTEFFSSENDIIVREKKCTFFIKAITVACILEIEPVHTYKMKYKGKIYKLSN
jgi:hypothetical protein